MILYEYPFNERIRTYLRLEHLFRNLGELANRESSLDHHFAIITLFEIIDVAARADLKSDVLKDIERQKNLFESYRGNPAISENALNQITSQLERIFTNLSSQNGKTGQALTDNEWLMSIRSRVGIPGGTCSFDLPGYYAWLNATRETRQSALSSWTSTISPLAESIFLLLKLLRDSGSPQKVVAQRGQFQQNLPAGRTFQLLRVRIDRSLSLVPEISGNRLLVSVRLMHQSMETKSQPSNVDASFEMSLCS